MLSDCLVLFPAHCGPGNVGWRNAAMGGEHWQEVFPFSGESNKVHSFGNRGIGSVGVRERQQAESLSRRKQQETPKRVGSRYPAKPQWLRRKREFLGGLCEFVTDWEGSESCWRESKIDPHQDCTVLRGRIFSFFKLFLKSVSPTKAEFSSFKNEKPLTTYPPHISNLTLATTLSILMIQFRDWWFVSTSMPGGPGSLSPPWVKTVCREHLLLWTMSIPYTNSFWWIQFAFQIRFLDFVWWFSPSASRRNSLWNGILFLFWLFFASHPEGLGVLILSLKEGGGTGTRIFKEILK